MDRPSNLSESKRKGKIGLVIAAAAAFYFVEYVVKLIGQRPAFEPSALAALFPPVAFRLFCLAIPTVTTLLYSKQHALPFALCYILPLICWHAANYGVFYAIPLVVFVLVPVIEIVSGRDDQNPTALEAKQLNNNPVFKWITWLWVPIQLVFVWWACWAAQHWTLSLGQRALFSVSVGITTGALGINIAHELIHKNNRLERSLGRALLVTVFYGHWGIEHIFGHHRYVSTEHDPASSRLGESFYQFWPRSVYGTICSGFRIEAERLRKLRILAEAQGPLSLANRLSLAPYGLANESVFLTCISCSLAWANYAFLGCLALSMFVCQSVAAFTMLEVVNYIEHYGLQRRQIRPNGSNTDAPFVYLEATGTEVLAEDGKPFAYEPVTVHHSWNADEKITNLFLFKLQRHSDHHAHASRRYQTLRSFKEAPQMPTGYAGMIVLAFFPPLWRQVMDPRVRAYRRALDQAQQPT